MTVVLYSCIAVLMYHFVLYPFLLLLWSALSGRRPESASPLSDSELPTVTVLVTCYNEGQAIVDKLDNLQQQDYPSDKLKIVFAADGQESNASTILAGRSGERVRVIEYAQNRGKIFVLNDTVPECTGDIVVFTDVTARFETDAIRQLVRRLWQPGVGGVCGYHRVVKSRKQPAKLSGAQGVYWRLDGLLKKAEDRISSITSCYGSIYAVRRELVTPLPSSVTDDAFQAMGVVRQGWRFRFAPEARAYIEARAKSPAHEISRRRRVVVRSLRGLWLSRELFDLRQHGFYALSLFSHKVLRRFMPVLLLLILVASAVLAFDSAVGGMLLVLQLLLYGTAALSFTRWAPHVAAVLGFGKPFSMASYFSIGQLGTLLGLIDFLLGKRVDRWVPAKSV